MPKIDEFMQISNAWKLLNADQFASFLEFHCAFEFTIFSLFSQQGCERGISAFVGVLRGVLVGCVIRNCCSIFVLDARISSSISLLVCGYGVQTLRNWRRKNLCGALYHAFGGSGRGIGCRLSPAEVLKGNRLGIYMILQCSEFRCYCFRWTTSVQNLLIESLCRQSLRWSRCHLEEVITVSRSRRESGFLRRLRSLPEL